jgi:hypothetical protein
VSQHLSFFSFLGYFVVANFTNVLQRCDDPSNGRKCKHVYFRRRGPDNLEAMHIMFGSAHVTGASASIPGDLSDNCSDDEVHEVERSPSNIHMSTMLQQKGKKRKDPSSMCADDKEDKSPFLCLYKQTCSKIEDGVNKITSSIEASLAPYMTSHIPTLAEAMRTVKECGVQKKTALMHTAAISIMRPEFRELLGLFETNEGRLDLL